MKLYHGGWVNEVYFVLFNGKDPDSYHTTENYITNMTLEEYSQSLKPGDTGERYITFGEKRRKQLEVSHHIDYECLYITLWDG